MLLHFQLTWGLLGNLCNNIFSCLGGKFPDSPWIDLIFRAASAFEAQSKKSWISFLHASSRNSFCFQQAIITDISVIQVASPFSRRRSPTRLARMRGLLGFSIGFRGFPSRARRPRRLGVAITHRTPGRLCGAVRDPAWPLRAPRGSARGRRKA